MDLYDGPYELREVDRQRWCCVGQSWWMQSTPYGQESWPQEFVCISRQLTCLGGSESAHTHWQNKSSSSR